MTHQRLSPLGWLGIALVVAIVLMALFGALSVSSTGGYYGMMGGGSWTWALLMMGAPGILLLVILLAALGALGDRRDGVPYTPGIPLPSGALQLLDERYARGELGREEYLRIRGDLAPDRPHA